MVKNGKNMQKDKKYCNQSDIFSFQNIECSFEPNKIVMRANKKQLKGCSPYVTRRSG